MHLDVQDLRNFYYRSQLGRVAQRALRQQMQVLWPEAKGLTVVGFGFPLPLLRPYLEDARRVISLMPGPQGVMPWPTGCPNISVLCNETSWPLDTGRVDRLVLLHGLETSEFPSALLEECFRVLGPGGRALFIVPNRAGLWARSDATPFGHGRPYTLGQLETQLRVHGFLPERHLGALFHPPSKRRFWMRAGSMMERFGKAMSGALVSGTLLLEVSKRVHAPTRGTPVKSDPVSVLDGLRRPVAPSATAQPYLKGK